MFDIHDRVYLNLIAKRARIYHEHEEIISRVYEADSVEGYSSKWAFIVELRAEQEAIKNELTKLIENRIEELKKK